MPTPAAPADLLHPELRRALQDATRTMHSAARVLGEVLVRPEPGSRGGEAPGGDEALARAAAAIDSLYQAASSLGAAFRLGDDIKPEPGARSAGGTSGPAEHKAPGGGATRGG